MAHSSPKHSPIAQDLIRRNGIPWVCPSPFFHSLAAWKHLPPAALRSRLRCALASRGVDEGCALYVVVVRHPVAWIASMQKQPYGLSHCLKVSAACPGR